MRKWIDLKNGKDVKISASLKTSPFKLPLVDSLPVTFICTGSGISPFRAFLQEIRYYKKKSIRNYNNVSLYFGCRKKNWDFLAKDEIAGFENDNIVSALRIAFSREESRKYVQDIVLEESEKITGDLLKKKGVVYVCGFPAYL